MVLIRNIVVPEEGLVYKSEQIKLKINQMELGIGTLFISEDNLSWKPENKSEGIVILWKQISVHGISNNPCKSVYFVIGQTIIWDGVYDPRANGNHGPNNNINAAAMDDDVNADDSDNDEGHESDCDDEFTELWLIPVESSAVNAIFQAMKECQTLHPDSADSISDESDFMDAVEEHSEDDPDEHLDIDVPAGADNDIDEVGQGDMRNLNLNEDQFSDAEDQ